ncbi:LOB domain-containing protein 36-like protein [Tanacetum coccineum]
MYVLDEDQPQKFAKVHKVYGASNVAKLLSDLGATQREDAVNSLAYEADARLRDPVYGCVGLISILQHRLKQVQNDLETAKRELARWQLRPIAADAQGAAKQQLVGAHWEQRTNLVSASVQVTANEFSHMTTTTTNAPCLSLGGSYDNVYQIQHHHHHIQPHHMFFQQQALAPQSAE